jgi:hypothetical protein
MLFDQNLYSDITQDNFEKNLRWCGLYLSKQQINSLYFRDWDGTQIACYKYPTLDILEKILSELRNEDGKYNCVAAAVLISRDVFLFWHTIKLSMQIEENESRPLKKHGYNIIHLYLDPSAR